MLYDDFHVIFGDFLVGVGDPRHIAKKKNEITLLYGCGFGLKKLGLGQTPPPPSLGQNPNIDRIFFWKLP